MCIAARKSRRIAIDDPSSSAPIPVGLARHARHARHASLGPPGRASPVRGAYGSAAEEALANHVEARGAEAVPCGRVADVRGGVHLEDEQRVGVARDDGVACRIDALHEGRVLRQVPRGGHGRRVEREPRTLRRIAVRRECAGALGCAAHGLEGLGLAGRAQAAGAQVRLRARDPAAVDQEALAALRVAEWRDHHESRGGQRAARALGARRRAARAHQHGLLVRELAAQPHLLARPRVVVLGAGIANAGIAPGHGGPRDGGLARGDQLALPLEPLRLPRAQGRGADDTSPNAATPAQSVAERRAAIVLDAAALLAAAATAWPLGTG
eukprot:CAMPEP_0202096874 /NCGR_PEP_ID=MMETSP0965-20130614/874_1 /ASSEMBLY_ACC=CAM_ASM_000507 /TAXON_ID=4773 /ORGANISM="Schizochytrium aggregatum, Strain ATCC28209" /LENGTH=325 /DNA_ID=CAMNT_0048665231 /DNA_START=375 /DNA_END=1350 /DNA_ORIENTATION=-